MAKPMRMKEGLCGQVMSYCISIMQGALGGDRPDQGLVLMALRRGPGGRDRLRTVGILKFNFKSKS